MAGFRVPQIGSRNAVGRPSPRSGFMRDGASPFFSGWQPALRESRDDVRVAWSKAAARTTDLIQNSGFVAGGVDQSTVQVVGTGLRLNAMPDAEALGITAGAAATLGRTIERRFELWADRPIECDIEGRRTLGQMSAAAYRGWLATGEIVALLPFRQRAGGQYLTKLQLLPSSRLAQTSVEPDIFQGVRLDGDGFPLAYRITTPRRWGGMDQVEIRSRDSAGRPRVVHVFDGLAGQVRGITPMAPALRVTRQFDQLADATLTAALIQAILVGTFTSDAPTEEVMEAMRGASEKPGGDSPFGDFMAARGAWYDNTKIDLGRFGKIAHLFSGDKLEFHGAQHPNEQYEKFASFLLREVARCMGLTYEDLTGDYRGSTYSSVRMATAAMWLMVLSRRSFIVAPLMQAAYEAWLEEEIDSGATMNERRDSTISHIAAVAMRTDE
jgi:lambda family phage portal protein